MQVVWFKRDLRIVDHEPLMRAIQSGPVLPLYILEPELWQQPDMSQRHYLFLQQCLADLNAALTALGQPLIIKVGNAVDVLAELASRHGVTALWSHQETWNGWTYQRDKAVKSWCVAKQIAWYEPVQNGVVRRLSDRNGWAARWYSNMKKPAWQTPALLVPIIEAGDRLPAAAEFGLSADGSIQLQVGGRSLGLTLLHSFLNDRGEAYTKAMSSPVSAFDSCSRLSAHLAFGTLSMREVFQACEKRSQEIAALPTAEKGKWPSAMRSFAGRLRWHCHFMQKLEDEPGIEFSNMHPAYNGLRNGNLNQDYYLAWQQGKTGYPMVDACMRCLTATGWLNFRMRAMVMSFASYHLWLHWRTPSLHLATLFTDYEPGIHYSQAQMQSGTTGINAIRIYNPIKQGYDQDPEGVFIRQWLPELRDMDKAYIHMPWQAPAQMNGYPMPIVDEKTARTAAASQLYSLRKNNTAHRETAEKIVKKHASRKPAAPKRLGKKVTGVPVQGELLL